MVQTQIALETGIDPLAHGSLSHAYLVLVTSSKNDCGVLETLMYFSFFPCVAHSHAQSRASREEFFCSLQQKQFLSHVLQ